MSARTIVVSDAHGEPQVVERVIEDSGFDAAKDRLIFAGDAVEVGRDSRACLRRLEELGAEFLVGNHEYEILRGTPVEWEPVDPRVGATIAERIRSGQWRLAAEAGGVLITHAGVSATFGRPFVVGHDDDVARLAERLNAAWDAFASGAPMPGVDVGGTTGPLWCRPDWEAPLPGIVQVIGHTPPEMLDSGARERWANAGIHLIDPCVRCWRRRGFAPPVPFRYATIENGEVQILESAGPRV